MDFFENKIVIVTGAASGIGRALSEELSRCKAILILIDRNAQLLGEVEKKINQSSGRAESAVIDVADRPAVEKLVENTVSKHGRLDYIFNNAGIAIFGEVRDCTYADWEKVLDVNLYGPINGALAAYPQMLRQGSGHIVNTASLAGLIPAEPLASYTAHGVVGMSLTLRMEGADLGVKVSVVCPGLIQTPIFNSRTININREKMLTNAPIGMAPEKCAKTILRGVRRNKAIIIVTAPAWFFWWLYRFSPRLTLWLGTLFIRRFRKDLRVQNT